MDPAKKKITKTDYSHEIIKKKKAQGRKMIYLLKVT